MAKTLPKDYETPAYLFHQGTNARAYDFLGAHPCADGRTVFRVWAPHAQSVSVTGDFNGWSTAADPMRRLTDGGLWECFVENVGTYDNYKIAIRTPDGREILKADPYAFHAETRPATASKFYDIEGYAWQDRAWLRTRGRTSVYDSPVNIY